MAWASRVYRPVERILSQGQGSNRDSLQRKGDDAPGLFRRSLISRGVKYAIGGLFYEALAPASVV